MHHIRRTTLFLTLLALSTTLTAALPLGNDIPSSPGLSIAIHSDDLHIGSLDARFAVIPKRQEDIEPESKLDYEGEEKKERKLADEEHADVGGDTQEEKDMDGMGSGDGHRKADSPRHHYVGDAGPETTSPAMSARYADDDTSEVYDGAEEDQSELVVGEEDGMERKRDEAETSSYGGQKDCCSEGGSAAPECLNVRCFSEYHKRPQGVGADGMVQYAKRHHEDTGIAVLGGQDL